MNLLYLGLTFVLLVYVDCNPLAVETDANQANTELPSDEISITTESVTIAAESLSENIELTTKVDDTTINSDQESLSFENQDCSHCLDIKYLKHYFAKGCQPIYDSKCKDCPKKFDCSKKQDIILGTNECFYNGSKYKIGDSVPVKNPCKICQCGYGFTHEYTLQYTTPFTTVHCITAECPEHFGVHKFPLVGMESEFEKLKNCYNIYEKNECCAVRKNCLETNEGLTDQKFCKYNDKNYKIGEKIYPNEDKCKVCICDENWDSNQTISNSGCYDVQCDLEVERPLKVGCIPIYHENTCCPVDYHCPEKYSEEDITICSEAQDPGPCAGYFERVYYDVRLGQCTPFVYGGCGGSQNNFRTTEECEHRCGRFSEREGPLWFSDESVMNYCIVNEIKYEIGSKLDINQKCVDCECRIPPDFTCIQRSCPIQPTNECKVTYNPNICCPIYDCNYNKTNDKLFDPSSCPTPMCMKGCQFETYPDKCPNCVCDPPVKEEELPANDLSDV